MAVFYHTTTTDVSSAEKFPFLKNDFPSQVEGTDKISCFLL